MYHCVNHDYICSADVTGEVVIYDRHFQTLRDPRPSLRLFTRYIT